MFGDELFAIDELLPISIGTCKRCGRLRDFPAKWCECVKPEEIYLCNQYMLPLALRDDPFRLAVAEAAVIYQKIHGQPDRSESEIQRGDEQTTSSEVA